jgi:hypothetical protein
MIIIAQVEGSGTTGVNTGIEKLSPAALTKMASGSVNEVALVSSWRFALWAVPLRSPSKKKEIQFPSDDRVALVGETPFAPDPPQFDMPHCLTATNNPAYPGALNSATSPDESEIS